MNLPGILNREQVRSAIKRQGVERIPRANILWHNQETREELGPDFEELTNQYPDDCLMSGMGVSYWNAPENNQRNRFAFGQKQKPAGLPDFACPIISDWSELPEFLEEFPWPGERNLATHLKTAHEAQPDRYLLVTWGHYLHQRLAYIRGTEPLMIDMFDAPEKLQQVMDALIKLYEQWAQLAKDAGADGIWAGDDLAHGKGLFMSPEIFRSLYAPYYKKLAEILHNKGLDFWLHSCGNIEDLLEDLIDCGVDVLHPLQYGTVNDQKVIKKAGGRITFWVGIDVQHILPFGTPDEIRAHVRERIDTFKNQEGGLVLGTGNSVMADTPIENLKAYLDEVWRYS